MRSALRTFLIIILMAGLVLFAMGAIGVWRWGEGPGKLGVVLDIHDVICRSGSVSDVQVELQRMYGSARVKMTSGESVMFTVTVGGRHYLAALPSSDAGGVHEVVACNGPSPGRDADYVLGLSEGGSNRFRCQIPPVPGCLMVPSDPDYVQYPQVARDRVREAYPNLWDKLQSMQFKVKKEPARDAEAGEGR